MPNVHRQMQAGFLVMPTALGLQMLAMLLVAQHLGPGTFGVFSVIFAVMNVTNFVAEMGLGTIVTKLVAEGKKPPAHYIALALPIVLAASLVGGVVMMTILCAAYSAGKVGPAAALASLNVILFGQSMVLSCAIRGLGQMGRWMTGFLGHKVALLVMVAAVLRPLGGGLTLAMAAWTVATATVLIYYLACVWRTVWRGQLAWSLAEVRRLLASSIPVGLISAANQFGMHLDTFILAVLLPDSAVGMYALGQRLINPTRNVLHGAVATPTFPGLCRLALNDRAEFSRRSTRLCQIQWVAGLPLALAAWVAAPLLVPRLLPQFTDTTTVICITVWALAPACVTLQLRYVYIAMSKQGRFLGLTVTYLVVKSAVLLVLTVRYGLLGACYGTVASELMLTVLALFGGRAMGIRLPLAKRIAVPTALTGGLIGLAWGTGAPPWLTVVLGACYLAVAAFLVNRLLRTVRRREGTDPTSRDQGTTRGGVSP